MNICPNPESKHTSRVLKVEKPRTIPASAETVTDISLLSHLHTSLRLDFQHLAIKRKGWSLLSVTDKRFQNVLFFEIMK